MNDTIYKYFGFTNRTYLKSILESTEINFQNNLKPPGDTLFAVYIYP